MGANASTTVPVYASGRVLDAARLNLTNAGVPVFSGTATRDAAFGGSGEKVLAEGQLCYLEDSDSVLYYDSSAWQAVSASGTKIGQVVSTSLLSAFSTSSTSYTDITGLSVAITPTLATSKVLVTVTLSGSQGTSGNGVFKLVRGATDIAVSTAGSNINGFAMVSDSYSSSAFSCAITFLDSPATTSATTYKIQGICESGVLFVNRRGQSAFFGTSSTITVSEVLV